jgi:hypothetical protein
LEPVVVNGGTFVMERMLDRPGDVLVGVGDEVGPDTVVARSQNVDKQVTLYAANELGLEADSLRKYLAKPIGSTVKSGDVIARVRRGLRTASVASPVDGTLLSADDSSGTIIVAASMGPHELRALVTGEVEQVVHGRGVVLRATGTRVYGIVGFGNEALGELVVGSDRNDRELTSESVDPAWRDKIVLAGLTAGVPALNRLREVGVAGVIIGSISESDIRRFLTPSGAEREGSAAHFWGALHGEGSFAWPALDVPFVIIATEGFGRRPMAEPIFSTLSQHGGMRVSVNAATAVGRDLRRPEIYITEGQSGSAERVTDALALGRQVRVVDPSQVGLVGVCVSDVYLDIAPNGMAADVAQIQIGDDIRIVPVANLEALV